MSTQLNDLLKEKLAYLISKELPLENGLVSILYVDCSPDMRHAKVGISVLPENVTGTVLKKLKHSGYLFAKELNKLTRLRRLPHFEWIIDKTEKYVAELEEVFFKIQKEKEMTD